MSKNKEKVIGFRIQEKDEARLKKDLHRQETTRKEWLNNNLIISESVHELSIKENEKWIRLPASEYDTLISNSLNHEEYIFRRILQHCTSQGIEITFENLFNEIKLFMKMNSMVLKKEDIEGINTIGITHNIGVNYSKFCFEMIKKMVKHTKQYSIFESNVQKYWLEIKLLTVNNVNKKNID